jgi:hypothetical protein
VVFPEFVTFVADEDFIRSVVGELVRFDYTDSIVLVVCQKFFVLILGWATVDNDDNFSHILSIAHGK